MVPPAPEIERLTITLPSEMAPVVRGAVEGGDHASSGEVVHEASRDWKIKRPLQLPELEALKADIDRGLTDLAEIWAALASEASEQIATRIVGAIEPAFEPLR